MTDRTAFFFASPFASPAHSTLRQLLPRFRVTTSVRREKSSRLARAVHLSLGSARRASVLDRETRYNTLRDFFHSSFFTYFFLLVSLQPSCVVLLMHRFFLPISPTRLVTLALKCNNASRPVQLASVQRLGIIERNARGNEFENCLGPSTAGRAGRSKREETELKIKKYI